MAIFANKAVIIMRAHYISNILGVNATFLRHQKKESWETNNDKTNATYETKR